MTRELTVLTLNKKKIAYKKTETVAKFLPIGNQEKKGCSFEQPF